MENKTYFLYQITTPSNQKYIGVTCDLDSRIRAHCVPSAKYRSAIGSAINKEGKENVKVEILETFTNKEDALNRERELVDNGFISSDETLNIVEGGGTPPSYGQTEKAIAINGIFYPSIIQAAKSLGMTRNQLDRKIKYKLIDFQFVETPKPIDLKGKEPKPTKRQEEVLFNNESFGSYKEACRAYGITKDELLKTRKFFGQSHVTLEQVISLRKGKKPIVVNGVEYASRAEARKNGITQYELYKQINNETRQPYRTGVRAINPHTGQVVKEFQSISDAIAFVNGKSMGHICSVCKKQRATAYGYKWEYTGDTGLTT